MNCVGIAGVGLIGASLGLALRRAGFTGEILGVSSDRSIRAGVETGAIDRGTTLDEAASRCDVLYLAQPISGILETIDQLGKIARPGLFITDAGSTKVKIIERAATALQACHFVGGHPMAGKEKRGAEAAEAGLFAGRPYVLTPADPESLRTEVGSAFVAWLERIGARLVTMSAEDHDNTVAYTSHLPQLASTALAALLGHLPDDRLRVAGPGASDMTRLAMSDYEIWRDILDTNRAPVDHALTVYIDKLTEIRNNLQTQRVADDFKVAAEAAAKLRQ